MECEHGKEWACAHCVQQAQSTKPATEEIEDLRSRLRDIYHMTLTYGHQPVTTLAAIRNRAAL